jgi:DNA-binding transcriptional LysR family regulator
MELRHLRYFIAVAEEAHFGRAAKRLRVAQSALSRQIHDLERELHVSLFDRLPRGVRLTPPGTQFLAEARLTLEQADRAVARARAAEDGEAGVLRLGCIDPLLYGKLFGRLVQRFRDRYPRVTVELLQASSPTQWTALRENRVDVALTFFRPDEAEHFHAEQLLDDPLCGVLLPVGHELAAAGPVRLAALAVLPLVYFPRSQNPTANAYIDAELAARGLVPRRGQEGTSLSLLAGFVAAGLGWMLATAKHKVHPISGTVFVPFREPPIPFWLTMLWRKEESSLLVHRFLEVAREVRAMAGAGGGAIPVAGGGAA